jgi:hypothetical protein
LIDIDIKIFGDALRKYLKISCDSCKYHGHCFKETNNDYCFALDADAAYSLCEKILADSEVRNYIIREEVRTGMDPSYFF